MAERSTSEPFPVAELISQALEARSTGWKPDVIDAWSGVLEAEEITDPQVVEYLTGVMTWKDASRILDYKTEEEKTVWAKQEIVELLSESAYSSYGDDPDSFCLLYMLYGEHLTGISEWERRELVRPARKKYLFAGESHSPFNQEPHIDGLERDGVLRKTKDSKFAYEEEFTVNDQLAAFLSETVNEQLDQQVEKNYLVGGFVESVLPGPREVLTRAEDAEYFQRDVLDELGDYLEARRIRHYLPIKFLLYGLRRKHLDYKVIEDQGVEEWVNQGMEAWLEDARMFKLFKVFSIQIMNKRNLTEEEMYEIYWPTPGDKQPDLENGFIQQLSDGKYSLHPELIEFLKEPGFRLMGDYKEMLEKEQSRINRGVNFVSYASAFGRMISKKGVGRDWLDPHQQDQIPSALCRQNIQDPAVAEFILGAVVARQTLADYEDCRDDQERWQQMEEAAVESLVWEAGINPDAFCLLHLLYGERKCGISSWSEEDLLKPVNRNDVYAGHGFEKEPDIERLISTGLLKKDDQGNVSLNREWAEVFSESVYNYLVDDFRTKRIRTMLDDILPSTQQMFVKEAQGLGIPAYIKKSLGTYLEKFGIHHQAVIHFISQELVNNFQNSLSTDLFPDENSNPSVNDWHQWLFNAAEALFRGEKSAELVDLKRSLVAYSIFDVEAVPEYAASEDRLQASGYTEGYMINTAQGITVVPALKEYFTILDSRNALLRSMSSDEDVYDWVNEHLRGKH
jgi:hypothetical protein